MVQFQETVIALTHPVKSLCWQGDTLVDAAGGYRSFALDGAETPASIHYAYRFDAAIFSPSGRYAAIYERLGTKGLILEGKKIVRQINSDFYQANVYEFPITFVQLPDGQELLIHCPAHYCQMEIEEVETGNCLTEESSRKAQDIFYSRLSSNGHYLLTTGWIWHPFDTVTLHDLHQALKESQTLDGAGLAPDINSEVACAAFLGNDKLILAGAQEDPLDEDEIENTQMLQPRHLAVYDLTSGMYLSSVLCAETIGTMMPVNDELIVGFYQHPKLISLKTGEIVHRWEHLQSGQQNSSIMHHLKPMPPLLALDGVHQRFAVAQDKTIHVIQFQL